MVAARDGAIRKLARQDGATLAQCRIPDATIQTLKLSPSKKIAFVLSDDRRLSRVDLDRFEVVGSVSLDLQPTAICAADDEVCFVAADSVDAWSLSRGTKICSLGAFVGPVQHLSFQPAQSRMFVVDAEGRELAVCLKDVSAHLENLGIAPLIGFARTADEKLARQTVDTLYATLVLEDAVSEAIDKRTDWSATLREGALAYARSRPQSDDELLAQVWRQLAKEDENPADVKRAQQIAAAFARRSPDDRKAVQLNARLQIRAGMPAEALRTINASSSADPIDIAVRLLAHLALQDETAARQDAADLRTVVTPKKEDPKQEADHQRALKTRLITQLAYGGDVISSRLLETFDSLPPSNLKEQPTAQADVRALVGHAVASYAAQAQAAVENQDWEKAANAYVLALCFERVDFQTLNPWSDALAMQGKWDEAAKVYAPAIADGNQVLPMLWLESLLQLADGDQQGYRATCDAMFKAHSETTDHQQAFMLALAGGIGQNALDDISRVLAIAKKATDADPKNPAYWSALGTAQYRNGQEKEAIETLKKAMPLHVLAMGIAPNMAAALQLSRLNGETTLALAYHKLGDQAAVDKQVATITKLIDTLEKSPPKPSPGLSPWAIKFAILISERELAGIGRQITRAK